MLNKKQTSYSEEIREEDTKKAIETLTVKLIPNDSSPWAIDFHGACPRCGHNISIRHWLVVVAGAVRLDDDQMNALASHLDELGIDLSQGDETLDLTCTCDVKHPNQPENKRGCGARFRVHVKWP